MIRSASRSSFVAAATLLITSIARAQEPATGAQPAQPAAQPATQPTDQPTQPPSAPTPPSTEPQPPAAEPPSAPQPEAPPPSPAPAPAQQPPAAAPGDPGAATALAGAGVGGRFRYANTWDLNIEGGAGYVLDVEKWTGFVRARPGVLLVRNDSFYQLGATAEYLGVLRRPAFGLQAEYLHLQLGVWVQAGASVDTKGRPGGELAVGLSVFGIEAQVREFDQAPDPTVAFIGKIRVPIGILVYGLTSKK